MSRRLKVALSWCGLFLLGGALVWLGVGTFLQGGGQAASESYDSSFKEIDEKAEAARTGDERAARELVEALFRGPQLDGVPSLLARPFKQRIARAEISYRQGRSDGIAEENIVRLFDELAQKFGAPEYARTDLDEVRAIRLALSHLLPHLIPREQTEKRTATEEAAYAVSPAMSPSEATFVALFLLLQKQLNERTLLTSAERAEVMAALRKLNDEGISLTPLERVEVEMALAEQKISGTGEARSPEELAALAKKATAELGGRPPQPRLVAKVASARQREVQAAFRRAESMGLFDAMALAHKALDTLGIER